jgi:chemotaxis protein methyltransferase CheR
MTENLKKIGITEYREIIASVQSCYGYDISDFAMTSLKRRIEKVYNLYNFNDVEDFISKLVSDEEFYETFLKEISVPTTEMFRDPQMWIELKDKILTKLKSKSEFKIWVPEFTSDDELFSLLIVLKETGCLSMSNIIASSYCKKNIEKLPFGIVDLKKMEVNSANYTRQEGDFQLSKYFDIEEKRAIFDNILLSEVKIERHNLFNDEPISSDFNLVMFRNKFLYYNLQLQNKVLEKLYNSLQIGGILIIGINESIDGSVLQNKFNIISKTENIFKKTR